MMTILIRVHTAGQAPPNGNGAEHVAQGSRTGMTSGNPHATGGHAVVGHRHQGRASLPLGNSDARTGGEAQLGQGGVAHASRRHPGVGGLLQGRRPANHGIGEIDGYVGNALQAAGGHAVEADGDAVETVVEAGDKFDAFAQCLVTHGLAGFVGEAAQIQNVAQNAQHLPGRTGVALGLDHTVEALHAAFGIDEGAGGFGEGSNGQHHVGVFQGRGVLESGHEDHQAGLFEGGQDQLRVGAVEFRFQTHQHIALLRLLEHGASVGSAGQCPAGMAADSVGRFAEETDRALGQLAQFEGQGMQLGRVGALGGNVAEEDGALVAIHEALGDGLARGAGRDGFQACRGCNALDVGGSLDHGGQVLGQCRRRHRQTGVQLDQLVVTGHGNQADLGVFLGGLAKALGDERVILAQEGTNH
jgi:hypothetical protein